MDIWILNIELQNMTECSGSLQISQFDDGQTTVVLTASGSRLADICKETDSIMYKYSVDMCIIHH